MGSKFVKGILLTVILFFTGILMSMLGMTKGEDWAINLSRPHNADSWTTSQGMVLFFQYGPAVLGLSFIILSMVLFTILFIMWLNKD